MLNQPLIILAIIPVIVGLFYFSNLSSPSKWLIGLLAFSFLTELVAGWVAIRLAYNLPVYAVYSLVSPLLFFIIYYQMKIRRSFRNEAIAFALLVSFLVINTLFIQPDMGLPTYNIQAAYLFVVGLSLSWYMNLIADPPRTKLVYMGTFWFNTGSFLHHMLLFFQWIVLEARIRDQINEHFSFYWTWFATILFWVFCTLSIIIDIKYGRKPNILAR